MADNTSVQALRAALQEFDNEAIEQERLRAERASMEAEDLRAQIVRQAARQADRATQQRAGNEALADSLELVALETVAMEHFPLGGSRSAKFGRADPGDGADFGELACRCTEARLARCALLTRCHVCVC